MKQTTLLSSLSKAILASRKQREYYKKSREDKKEKEEKKKEEIKIHQENYKKYREENNLRNRFRSKKMVTSNEKEKGKGKERDKEREKERDKERDKEREKEREKEKGNENNVTPNIIKELKRSEKMQNLFIPEAVQKIDEPWDDTCVVMYDILDPNISDKESDKMFAVNYDNVLELDQYTKLDEELDQYTKLDEELDQYTKLDEELTDDSDDESDEESNDESDEESVLESNKVCFRNTQIVKLYGNKGIEDLADSSFKVNILNSKTETIGVVLSFDNSHIK